MGVVLFILVAVYLLYLAIKGKGKYTRWSGFMRIRLSCM